jgi:hypothetical protein
MSDTEERIEALRKCIGFSPSVTIEKVNDKDDSYEFQVDRSRMHYLVMTEDEADKSAAQYIRMTVWAFNSNWLADFMPNGISAEHLDTLREGKEDSEGLNEAFTALIEAGNGMDEFIERSIAMDGRAHFMSTYDGEEHEENGYLIYRI